MDRQNVTENRFDNEIDVLPIARKLLSKIWIVIIVAIIGAIIMVIETKMLVTPMYQSTIKLYIINRQNDNTTSYSDIQISTQLVKDYKVLVTSLPVVDQVINNLNLDMTEDQLIGQISCAIESDSRVLSITVTNPDPYMAKKIVDEVADVSAKQITSVMKIEGVNVIEYGRIPAGPSSPNVKSKAVKGGLAGAMLALVVIVLRLLMDDTIKNADDIERYLGISNLSMIPLTKEEYNGRKKKKHRRK